MRIRIVPLIAVLFAATVHAQGPPKPEAQIQAIATLQAMAGNWSGEGWMEMGGRRATFRGTEVVQMKLGGTAMLVEGNFFAKIRDTDVPVHTTLGVISFNPETKKYRFNTWLAIGTSGEHEIKLTENGWQWELSGPRGAMRYTITLTDNQWFEIGERSADGTAWNKFFEMTLRKK